MKVKLEVVAMRTVWKVNIIMIIPYNKGFKGLDFGAPVTVGYWDGIESRINSHNQVTFIFVLLLLIYL
jgi:thiosulfate reductase cytochrome b subunit